MPGKPRSHERDNIVNNAWSFETKQIPQGLEGRP